MHPIAETFMSFTQQVFKTTLHGVFMNDHYQYNSKSTSMTKLPFVSAFQNNPYDQKNDLCTYFNFV